MDVWATFHDEPPGGGGVGGGGGAEMCRGETAGDGVGVGDSGVDWGEKEWCGRGRREGENTPKMPRGGLERGEPKRGGGAERQVWRCGFG